MRARALFKLALARTTSGAMTIVGYVMAALTTLGALAVVPLVRTSSAALLGLSAASTWALAWGAGVLVAFAAALHSLRRDREEGIVALLTSRGHRPMAYVTARVFGLVLVLLAVVGGGSLLVSLVTMALARGGHDLARAAQNTAAALVYSACFAVTVGPIALASLGARSRAGGYVSLLLTLFVPEMLAPLTARVVPRGWEQMVSVPHVLAAARAAIAPPGIDAVSLARALVVIAAIAIVATLVVRGQVARVAEERP